MHRIFAYSPKDVYTKSITYLKRMYIVFKPWFAAAAAKSLQSCPTLCDPIDGSPPRSPVPGILQAKTLEWVAISFSKILVYKTSKSGIFPTLFFSPCVSSSFSREISICLLSVLLDFIQFSLLVL